MIIDKQNSNMDHYYWTNNQHRRNCSRFLILRSLDVHYELMGIIDTRYNTALSTCTTIAKVMITLKAKQCIVALYYGLAVA